MLDKIMVMDHGRLAGFAHHDILIRECSIYQELIHVDLLRKGIENEKKTFSIIGKSHKKHGLSGLPDYLSAVFTNISRLHVQMTQDSMHRITGEDRMMSTAIIYSCLQVQ